MFEYMLVTIIQFIPVLVVFICGFAFAFHVIRANSIDFSSISMSIIKCMVMLVGEYEYATLFTQKFSLKILSKVFEIRFLKIFLVWISTQSIMEMGT